MKRKFIDYDYRSKMRYDMVAQDISNTDHSLNIDEISTRMSPFRITDAITISL